MSGCKATSELVFILFVCLVIWSIGLMDFQNVIVCICETIMAEVLIRARALGMVVRNVLHLNTLGHTL